MVRVALAYGQFVPPRTWCSLICPKLLANPSPMDLMILSNIIRGSDEEEFKAAMEDVCLTLQDDFVLLTHQVR